MPKIRWKTIVLALTEVFLTFAGVYALGHVVKAYVRWGYPPWAHFVAGALFLTAAALLPFRRTRWLGALSALCVAGPAAATCALHGDYADTIQGIVIMALIGWLARSNTPAADRVRAE